MAWRLGAQSAVRVCPGLKVLYMSGYTADVIERQGGLEPGVQLVNKPFRKVELARKVRQRAGRRHLNEHTERPI